MSVPMASHGTSQEPPPWVHRAVAVRRPPGGDLRRDRSTARRLRHLRETCETEDEAKVAVTKLLRLIDDQHHPKSAVTVREAIEQRLDVADLEVCNTGRR